MPPHPLAAVRTPLEKLRAAEEVPAASRAAAEEAAARMETAYAADPTLELRRGWAARCADVAGELMRQIVPLARQAAQIRTGQVPPGTRISPETEAELDARTARLVPLAVEVEAEVWHDWDTPAGRACWAAWLMPDPNDIAALAAALRDEVREAAEAGHPEARRLMGVAEQIAPAPTGAPAHCAGPGCSAVLQERAETGRPRRYCSPACRSRAARTRRTSGHPEQPSSQR